MVSRELSAGAQLGGAVKIAMYWNDPCPLVAATIRHDLYARELEKRGHEVVTACLTAASRGVPGQVVAFDDRDEPRRQAFWDRIRPDVLIVITWLWMREELEIGRAHV